MHRIIYEAAKIDNSALALFAAMSIHLQGFFDAIAYGVTPVVYTRWLDILCHRTSISTSISQTKDSDSFAVEVTHSSNFDTINSPIFDSQAYQQEFDPEDVVRMSSSFGSSSAPEL